jgi:mannosyl-oligosaccharide alpha-1,2-mannosidase
MGLEEEFEDAVKAVEQIDFTTTPRDDIPVFETTIRYLGGLLAAYDVSGGKYKVLLDKAVELGEILMGTFDTPNRMPVLYYRWKPAFASQPHRASQRSNLAELGSLTMEFTRLAQLTKEPRYYDAVARVTNALSEYQDRGTKLGNVFPENIDASGCNRTMAQLATPVSPPKDIILPPADLDKEPEGYKPDIPQTVREPRPVKKSANGGPPTLELNIMPGDVNVAHISESVEEPNGAKLKRDAPPQEAAISNQSTSTATDPVTGLPAELSGVKDNVGTSLETEWDCVAQGLDSPSAYGSDKFSMGGGQDSTYEYFPKVSSHS